MKQMLNEVGYLHPISKRCMSNFLVAYMTCDDVDIAIKRVGKLTSTISTGVLSQLVEMVYNHVHACEKAKWYADDCSTVRRSNTENTENNHSAHQGYPWNIDREYIMSLGSSYLMFVTQKMIGEMQLGTSRL